MLQRRSALRLPSSSLALLAAMAIASVVGLAACGGGGSTGATTGAPSPKQAAAHYSQALAFSKCMRSHGVTSFPDPTSGGGIQIGSNSGINPFAPSFKSAQAACSKLLPGGGPGNAKPDPQAKKTMLQISVCMRSHGITAFPDPTTTAPTSPAGYGLIMGRGGYFLAIPQSLDPQSPAFQKAASACNFGGPPRSK